MEDWKYLYSYQNIPLHRTGRIHEINDKPYFETNRLYSNRIRDDHFKEETTKSLGQACKEENRAEREKIYEHARQERRVGLTKQRVQLEMKYSKEKKRQSQIMRDQRSLDRLWSPITERSHKTAEERRRENEEFKKQLDVMQVKHEQDLQQKRQERELDRMKKVDQQNKLKERLENERIEKEARERKREEEWKRAKEERLLFNKLQEEVTHQNLVLDLTKREAEKAEIRKELNFIRQNRARVIEEEKDTVEILLEAHQESKEEVLKKVMGVEEGF
eukprot:TRINITY_DN1534_c0_g1_i3.p1 TRINITY_DN1534_c0_g1~~TRINITY_DN1534_c0_g1_i3.p1  ORF type:complete len:275 (-),score=88.30 TRINITY_DN1534_c0_g1_i3:103-927(-)